MKIGIFGGSFNPVHLGHYEIVKQLLKVKKADRIYVVPARQNPLKESLPDTPEPLRVDMIKKTFQHLDEVFVSDVELKRPYPSFTVDSLRYFKQKHPDDQLVLVMGMDTFALFNQWKSPDQILKMAELLVFKRPAQLSTLEEQTDLPRHDVVDVKIPDVSATEIRSMNTEQIQQKNCLHKAAEPLWLSYLAEKTKSFSNSE